MTDTALPTPQLSGRQWLIAAALGLAVAAFHFFHGIPLAKTVLLQSFNWMFDFDSSRFVGGWCTPGANVVEDINIGFAPRHALSLATRPLCLGLNALIGNPYVALMALTALCAGAAVAIAYLLAASFCAAEFDRILLALGFAVSAQPLMMGVIPETYGFALAGVGLHLMLVARKRPAPLGAGPAGVISLFLDLGVTLTNGALNLLSSIVQSWQRMGLRQWLRMELRTWLWAVLALALVVVPLAALYTPTLLQEAGTAPKHVWWVININRGEPATLAEVIRAFLVYNFVGPAYSVYPLPAPESHPMLDFRALNFGLAGALAAALWVLALCCSVYLALRKGGVQRYLWILLGWLLINIVLHWYWQYRGSVYLYGAHNCFALFGIGVLGYAIAVRERYAVVARSAAVVMIGLAAVNNIGLYLEMIDFLRRQPLAP